MKLALACECVFWAVSNSLMIVIKTKEKQPSFGLCTAAVCTGKHISADQPGFSSLTPRLPQTSHTDCSPERNLFKRCSSTLTQCPHHHPPPPSVLSPSPPPPTRLSRRPLISHWGVCAKRSDDPQSSAAAETSAAAAPPWLPFPLCTPQPSPGPSIYSPPTTSPPPSSSALLKHPRTCPLHKRSHIIIIFFFFVRTVVGPFCLRAPPIFN